MYAVPGSRLAVVSQFLVRAGQSARTVLEHEVVVEHCLELVTDEGQLPTCQDTFLIREMRLADRVETCLLEAIIRSKTWEAVNELCVAFSQHGHLTMLTKPLNRVRCQGHAWV